MFKQLQEAVALNNGRRVCFNCNQTKTSRGLRIICHFLPDFRPWSNFAFWTSRARLFVAQSHGSSRRPSEMKKSFGGHPFRSAMFARCQLCATSCCTRTNLCATLAPPHVDSWPPSDTTTARLRKVTEVVPAAAQPAAHLHTFHLFFSADASWHPWINQGAPPTPSACCRVLLQRLGEFRLGPKLQISGEFSTKWRTFPFKSSKLIITFIVAFFFCVFRFDLPLPFPRLFIYYNTWKRCQVYIS